MGNVLMSPCEIRFIQLTVHALGTQCGLRLQSDTGTVQGNPSRAMSSRYYQPQGS
jgi:hypothetical protein